MGYFPTCPAAVLGKRSSAAYNQPTQRKHTPLPIEKRNTMQTSLVPAPADDADSRKWWSMFGIGLGVLMSTLDSSIVNIALPTLVVQLDTTFPVIQWVVLSYLVVITAAMLGIARLGDMVGKKRVYMTGLAIFSIGSLLCGLSPTVGWLIGFRALQGTGAVMMTSLSLAIITEIFPSEERGRALGIMGAIVSIGIALGPSVGGVLVGLVSWRAIFLVNVPIGVVAVLAVWKVVPNLAPRTQDRHFDLAGALIVFGTLAAYALGMTLGQQRGFQDGLILALLGLAVVGLVAFVVVESRVKHPMLDLSLFTDVVFGINLLMGLLVFIVMAGMFIFPFFLELVKGYPTAQVGLMMVAVPAMMGLIAPLAGTLSDRYGSRAISLLGLIVTAGGCLAISTLHQDVTVWGFVLRLGLFGFGIGIVMSPNNSAIMGTAPPDQLGVVSGLLALTRTLGQTSGLPLIGALFTIQVFAGQAITPGMDVTSAPAAALVRGVGGTYRIAAFIILGATALAALAMILDSRRKRVSGPLPQTVDDLTPPS
jgi:EmrB/QacA subfamily drug resistance transporter